jgi:hypothetical protein
MPVDNSSHTPPDMTETDSSTSELAVVLSGSRAPSPVPMTLTAHPDPSQDLDLVIEHDASPSPSPQRSHPTSSPLSSPPSSPSPEKQLRRIHTSPSPSLPPCAAGTKRPSPEEETDDRDADADLEASTSASPDITIIISNVRRTRPSTLKAPTARRQHRRQALARPEETARTTTSSRLGLSLSLFSHPVQCIISLVALSISMSAPSAPRSPPRNTRALPRLLTNPKRTRPHQPRPRALALLLRFRFACFFLIVVVCPRDDARVGRACARTGLCEIVRRGTAAFVFL